jgi:hypothetical protein
MKIGDFARAGGVNVETIRYYQLFPVSTNGTDLRL